MARLAAVEKGEYYPTPVSVVETIANRIIVNKNGRQVLRILDPCCGAGTAAARLAEILRNRYTGLRVQTWGVEINSTRAEEARGRLDHVVHAPFEAVSWSPEKTPLVSILFLNPPYDTSSIYSTRMERVFLDRALPLLEPEGLLVYIVPPAAVEAAYSILVSWFKNLCIYRFPDPEFSQFNQVVIFGNKMETMEYYPDWGEAARTPLGRIRYHQEDAERLPDLNSMVAVSTVPTVARGKIFRFTWIEDEIRDLNNETITRHLLEMYSPEEGRQITPLLMPKKGHLASIVAAGLMGTMHFPGEVLKGRAVKAQVLVDREEDDEVIIETVRDRYENHIVRVTSSGVEHISQGQIKEFLEKNSARLARMLEARLQPYGNSATPEENAILDRLSPDRLMPGMEKPGLLAAQREAAIALVRSVRKHGVGHLVAEMGFGKTTVALAAVELLGAYPAVVLCPPHLVDKWARETQQVVPGAKAVVVESVSELQSVMNQYQQGDKLVVVISRSYAKLGSGWEPAYSYRNVLVRKEGERPQWKRVPACPVCGGVVTGPTTSEDDLKKRPHFCHNRVERFRGEFVEEECGTPLFQVGTKLRRVPLAEFIAKKAPGFFRLLVVDEVHQYKAKSSDQGWAFQVLAKTIPCVTLTGTFFGGPSSSIFWLLHRTQPEVRIEYGFSDESKWIDHFGVRESKIVQKKGDAGYSYYRARKRTHVTARERPGISPAIMRFLLPTTVFKTLADLGVVLPPFRDAVVRLEMTPEQEADYRFVWTECWDAMREFWPYFTSSWLQWTLSRPNSCFREEAIQFPDGRRLVVPPVIHDHRDLLPKESWLLGCISKELQEGRKVVVYLRQTGTRDIRQRVVDVLRIHAGIDAVVLNESVDPRKREAWLKSRSPRVLLTNPRLVETGLDLVDYSTVIWFEPDYSLYTLWQACRRVWRLGQVKPVKVYYLVYGGSTTLTVMEELALDLIGQKLAFAQLLYGEDVAGAIVPDLDDNLVVQILRALESSSRPDRVKQLFGPPEEDLVLDSPVGSPTRATRPILSWDEWLERAGVQAGVQAQARRRDRKAVLPSQTLFDWATAVS